MILIQAVLVLGQVNLPKTSLHQVLNQKNLTAYYCSPQSITAYSNKRTKDNIGTSYRGKTGDCGGTSVGKSSTMLDKILNYLSQDKFLQSQTFLERLVRYLYPYCWKESNECRYFSEESMISIVFWNKQFRMYNLLLNLLQLKNLLIFNLRQV